MRDVLGWGLFILVFTALFYGGKLQDRARRKAYPPGTSLFSPAAMVRSFGTKEIFYFVLLMAALIVLVGIFIALDEVGYLAR